MSCARNNHQTNLSESERSDSTPQPNSQVVGAHIWLMHHRGLDTDSNPWAFCGVLFYTVAHMKDSYHPCAHFELRKKDNGNTMRSFHVVDNYG